MPCIHCGNTGWVVGITFWDKEHQYTPENMSLDALYEKLDNSQPEERVMLCKCRQKTKFWMKQYAVPQIIFPRVYTSYTDTLQLVLGCYRKWKLKYIEQNEECTEKLREEYKKFKTVIAGKDT